MPSTSDETVESEAQSSSHEALELISTDNGLTVGGIDYQVSDSFNKNTLPEGFEETTFSYKGREVKAGKMKDKEVYILYLVGNDGSGDFYIYDSDNDRWSVYAQISISQRVVTIMPLDEGVEVPKGFVPSSIDINGKKVGGWVWGSDNEKRYCVVYAMNSDGRKDFYRYDIEERTIQRYFIDPNADAGFTSDEYAALQKKYDTLNTNSKNMIYALIALSVTLAVILLFVFFAVSASKNSEKVNPTSTSNPNPTKPPKENKSKANISKKVNLISEDEMSDESPLEYMPLNQKKEDEEYDIGIDDMDLTSADDMVDTTVDDFEDDFEDLDI